MKFYLVVFVVINISAMSDNRFFFPVVRVDKETQEFLDIIESRQWQKGNRAQIKLFGELTAGSMGECRYHMDQYRLRPSDYQPAAKDPLVLQAWLADIPPDVRDIQIKRFFSEMTFTNNVKVLQLLDSWGLRAGTFEPEFLSRLIRRATNSNYPELAAYLTELSNSSRSIWNPIKCTELKP